MAQLIVRNIPKALVAALKRRAAKHGRSAEAEHRALLESVLGRRSPGTFKELLLAMPPLGEDEDFERRRDNARRVEL
jgi:plasmid stability protein